MSIRYVLGGGGGPVVRTVLAAVAIGSPGDINGTIGTVGRQRMVD